MMPARTRQTCQALGQLEPVTAPLCALALLFHPSPLSWPALAVGALPLAARWLTAGRPWRPTPFDPALALFGVGTVVGFLVTLDPPGAAVRLTGLASAVILFAWLREHAATPRATVGAALVALALVGVLAVLVVHVAAPFLRLDRAPPLALLAQILEPLSLYRLLAADPDVLQRFRLYASGLGALAATGLAMAVGLALAATSHRQRLLHGAAGLCFGALLYVADNRGSMVAAALTLGCLVVWWRPSLLPLAALLLFGTLDLIALGMVQRGLNLRTIVERLEFWRNGLLLAAETPLTGVGLGVGSVQAAYRAAFQPTYPPFNHTHSVYVQVLVEQGIAGLLGLVLLGMGLLRLGPRIRALDDSRERASGFAAAGGALALLAAGLTEIVALTTLGGALLFALLGLVAAVRDRPASGSTEQRPARTPGTLDRWISRAGQAPRWPAAVARSIGRRSGLGSRRGRAVAAALALGALLLTGLARPLLAVPFLNAGTSALLLATHRDDLDRAARRRALSLGIPALRTAAVLDPDGVTARRNLALTLAAAGDRDEARRVADAARARASSDPARFGVGRAYAATEAWDSATDVWAEAAAGPQLLRLGRQLTAGQQWETGVQALVAAARTGAPGRSAPDAITRAALARGLSTEEAIDLLLPLVETGGTVEYHAWLQIAHVYREAGQLDLAEMALAWSRLAGHDAQAELERALILAAGGQLAKAEELLRWLADHPIEPPQAIPEGDDPAFWLATVQARQGKAAEALQTARAGLQSLPAEQAVLRPAYHALIGESLLALDRPREALAAFQAGQRLAPGDPRLAEGAARARAAGR